MIDIYIHFKFLYPKLKDFHFILSLSFFIYVGGKC